MKLVGRKKVTSNQVFNIYFDHVVSSNGHEVPEYLVVSAKNETPEQVTGVGILPVATWKTGVRKIGLVRLYRHPVQKMLWEIPRGFVDSENHSSESALRELEEEMGIVCQQNQLKSLGRFFPEPGILSAQVEIFVAELSADQIPDNFSSHEIGHEKVSFFTLEEIWKFIQDGEIMDPSTLLAVERFSRESK